MNNALKTAFKALDHLSNALIIVGGLASALLVVVTVVAVFSRYVLGDPIFGIDDVSKMLLSAVVAGSILYGAKIGAHVQVDIISMAVGRKVTRIFDVIIRLFSAGVALLVAVALWDEIQCGHDCGYFTPNLEISHAPFHWLLAISMVGYALLQLLDLVEGLGHFRDQRDVKELR